MLDHAPMVDQWRLIIAARKKIAESRLLLRQCGALGPPPQSPTCCRNDPYVAGPRGSVIFGLQDRRTWASWTESACRIDLGPAEIVDAMMRDYLVQSEIAKRLCASASW